MSEGIAHAKSIDKSAGPLERELIQRSETEPEIRLPREDIGRLFAEIGDRALLGLLQATRNGQPICKIGNAVLVVDLPPVRSAAQSAPAVLDHDRVTKLEGDMVELKGMLAAALEALKAK